jgi:hypothetical protein
MHIRLHSASPAEPGGPKKGAADAAGILCARRRRGAVRRGAGVVLTLKMFLKCY